MNEISNIRIFRWTLACLIVFTTYSLIFGVGIASAETGNVTVTDQSILSYTVNDGAGTAGSVMNQIYLDTTDYNDFESFHINLSLQSPTFALDSETSQFTCSAGGTCAGYVWYVKEYQKLYFAFTSLTVTSSPITLSYTKNILANITGMTRIKSDCNPSITQPILLYKETVITPRCLAGLYESVTVDSTTTDQYVVTYPFANAFTLNVTKGGSVNDKWLVYDVDGNVYMDGTMDKKNFALTNNSYNGIIANVSLPSGAFTIVNINISGVLGAAIPDSTPTIDPLTGVGITWGKSSYALGAIGNISWVKTTPIFSCDIIRIYDETNTEKDFLENPADSGFYKTFLGTTGQWKAEYRRTFCVSGFGLGSESILETAYTSVNPETPSYILINESVPIGKYVNTTYRIGWIPSGIVSIKTYKSSDVITPENVYIVSNTQNTDITTQIMITSAGLHYVKLCDSLLGCKAQTLTTAFYNGSVPTTNITISNITMDKSAYSYGDHAQVQVQVDNYNWSNKLVGVYSYNWDYGITQHQQFITSQIESYDQYISDTTFTSPGNYSMRLVGENDTGVYILAFWNFTLAEVDAEGYGLSLSNTSLCVGDSANIKVTVPSAAFLNISFDNAAYNKNFYINNSKIIPFKFSQLGTYYITLHSLNMEAKRVIIISTNDCITPTPTVTVSSQTSLDLANLLSTNIFWALIMTVGLMIGVAVAISKREEQ